MESMSYDGTSFEDILHLIETLINSEDIDPSEVAELHSNGVIYTFDSYKIFNEIVNFLENVGIKPQNIIPYSMLDHPPLKAGNPAFKTMVAPRKYQLILFKSL